MARKSSSTPYDSGGGSSKKKSTPSTGTPKKRGRPAGLTMNRDDRRKEPPSVTVATQGQPVKIKNNPNENTRRSQRRGKKKNRVQ